MDIKSVINALHSPVSNPPRSGKDLSHRKVFSMKAGELLPILCEECVPEDYFEIDLAALVRTITPMQTAAFVRAKVHFDFFFVPMTSIWRNFEAFYYQRSDNYTSYKQGDKYEPNIRLVDMIVGKELGNSNIVAGIRDSKQARAKILELLGYGSWYNATAADFAPGAQYGAIADKSLTCLPLYAYNRIYNLHYRNAWLDEPNQTDIEAMSADILDCSTYLESLVYPDTSLNSNPDIPDLIKMHYHQYPQDLFQGLLPSQQFGVVSTVRFDNKFSTDVGDVSYHLGITAAPATNLAGIPIRDSSNIQVGGLTSNGSFDIMTLRSAIALQKWKEYNARAGWKAGDQQRAMFGVGEASDRVHDVEYIDSYQFPIMIDEVVQSSPASISGVSSPLGELGGKAIGVGNGHTIKFNVGKRWGYLMCIAYILPQSEYDATGIDKMLVRSTPDQHYTPAYANLGLEPVFKFELNALGNPAVFDNTLGFSTRYHEYKSRIDKVYCHFKSNYSLSNWVSVRRDLAGIANSGSIPTSYLYVNPSVLDTVFYSQSDGQIGNDQFMINCNFNVKAVRSMSDLGLPVM